MKYTIVSATVLAVVLLSAAVALANSNTVSYKQPVVPSQPTLTSEQQAWLGALEWCESGGNPKAINPKDRDGTPSYGLLQFKPSTFALFAKLYGLGSTTDYMNPVQQQAIVTQMILRGNVDMHQQFPGCTARLGSPPLSPTR